MKYFLFQLLILFSSAMFVLFLFQQESFQPFDLEGNVDWYNVSTLLFFVFLFLQGLLSTLLYLFQKFLTCGLKEFPSFGASLKWGLLLSFIFILLLLLNIFHIINFVWFFVIFGLIVLFLFLIKF